MTLFRLCLPAVLFVLPSFAASAASFDCSKAGTPFEHAICNSDELSLADDRLAKTFATAIGGLTKQGVGLMRTDQRNWLDYAQRSCTDDAQPLTRGEYDEKGASCLVDSFDSRSSALEQSRMIAGHRFLIKSVYAALPDAYEADNPDSYWKVASHSVIVPQLDADDPLAGSFNGYVMAMAENQSEITELTGGNPDEIDSTSNSDVIITVKEVAGTGRITMTVSNSWYGHGAAHGNWSLTYLHYLVEQKRGLEASDMFAGKGWADTLIASAWDQLQAEHGEWLQVDKAEDIAQIVVDPRRWDISNDYGLVIQFQPYEVSAYAYGAPTITIPWEKLDAIKADTQGQVRFGY